MSLCRRLCPKGTFLNVAADFYKAGAKEAGAGFVPTGPYAWSLRPNFFGGRRSSCVAPSLVAYYAWYAFAPCHVC